MDEDDQPKIIVKGWKDDAEIYLSVTDNGMGMRHEDVENILKDNQKGPKHGSGVGLINVHTRIQLMFGNKYGLIVESELDEGTTVYDVIFVVAGTNIPAGVTKKNMRIGSPADSLQFLHAGRYLRQHRVPI